MYSAVLWSKIHKRLFCECALQLFPWPRTLNSTMSIRELKSEDYLKLRILVKNAISIFKSVNLKCNI